MKLKLVIWVYAVGVILYMLYRLGFAIESLAPFSALLYSWSGGFLPHFPQDPIKFISDITGITALQYLIATLSVTPMRRHLKINILRHRRLLGLMSFFFALLHMTLYLWLDHEWKFSSLLDEAVDKKFIFFGMMSILMLTFMALTSTRSLFARYNRWHKMIYLVAIFIALHYYLSRKVMSLEPALYILLLLGLLGLRIFGKQFKKLRA